MNAVNVTFIALQGRRAVRSREDFFTWTRRVTKDRRLPAAHRLAARALSDRLNFSSGRCDPSLERLADDAGMSKSTAAAALKQLAELGWIIADKGGGRGRSTVYALTFAPEAYPVDLQGEHPSECSLASETVRNPDSLEHPKTVRTTDSLSQENCPNGVAKQSGKRTQTYNRTYPPLYPPAEPQPTTQPVVTATRSSASDSGEDRERFWGPDTRWPSRACQQSRRPDRKDRLTESPSASTPLRFFVREDSTAWNAWQAHLRANGKPGSNSTHSREHRAHGWWFPSEWPPGETGGAHAPR